MNPRWPLFALAVGAFGIGTTEFAPMGLLPVIADGVGVSIPKAGLLVSAYAIGVMAGAPLMTVGLSRMQPKRALILLMGIFTLGNLLSAVAAGYGTLLTARLVTSLSHGAFFGIGSVVAASLVPANRRASAVAAMFMGLTIVNIGGVPAATWVGQRIGWRAAFAGTAGLGVAAMLALVLAVPRCESGRPVDLLSELKVLSRPAVLLALATTIMGAGAMFSLYTYVAPVLIHLTGATHTFITLMLMVIGIGFSLGNGLGGWFADYSLRGAVITVLIVLALIMLVFPLAAGSHVGAALVLLLWGMATFAFVPPQQIRVMQAAQDAPGLASAANIGTFNLGNALGAAAGGVVISAGAGYAAIPLAGAVLAILGLMLVLVSDRRTPARQLPASGGVPGAHVS